ncbi:transglutaminase family protein [Chloroflexota bacterium]
MEGISMIAESLFRSIRWGVHKIGGNTLITVLLLVAIIGSITTNLAANIRGIDGGILVLTSILALLIGWILARTSLPGWKATIWAIAAGATTLVITKTNILDDSLELSRAVVNWVQILAQQGFAEPLPDAGTILTASRNIGAEINSLFLNLTDWTTALLQQKTIHDPTAVYLVWGMVMWGTAVWAGWTVRRRKQPLVAVLPVCVIFASSMSIVRGQILSLILVLGAVLMLIAWYSFTTQIKIWQLSSIDYSEDIQLDLVIWVILICGAILFLSWLVSYLSPQRILKTIQEFAQEQSIDTQTIGDSLGLRSQFERQDEFAGWGAGVLPRQHLLGSGSELSEQIAILVKLNPEKDRGKELAHMDKMPPLYWRELIYDVYTGRGWASSPIETHQFRAGVPVTDAMNPQRFLIHQEFEVIKENENLILYAGELVTAKEDFTIAYRSTPGDHRDIFGGLIDKRSYKVESLIPTVGESQLLSVNEQPPQWIMDRYLQMPESVPSRVHDLALDLTAGIMTDYEKARRLEDYLRNVPYTLDVPAPPFNKDVADYFLFDLREGYCDYYATSMVVMARAVGLPARLVMGFASGTYDESQNQYVVTEADAHSWVEIYFQGFGWIEFEPTGGQPAILRPHFAPMIEVPAAENLSITIPGVNLSGWLRWLLGMIFLLGLLVFTAMVWLVGDIWRLHRKTTPAVLETLYRRLYRFGEHLHKPPEPHNTPLEFSTILKIHFKQLINTRNLATPLSGAGLEIQKIIKLYSISIYSQVKPDQSEKNQAIRRWKRLRFRLWLARFFIY